MCKSCKQNEWQRANKAWLKEKYLREHDKRLARAREYYYKNREARLDYAARRDRRHPLPPPVTEEQKKQNARARRQRWHEKNPGKTAEAVKAWAKANPDKRNAYNHVRRTRETQAGGSYSVAEWKALRASCNGVCPCCQQSTSRFHADHVVPVAWGGPSYIWNLQPLCAACNFRKSAAMVVSLLPYRGPDAIGDESNLTAATVTE